MRLIFIGLGGIGTILVEKISRYLNFKTDEESYQILLVDGDHYEPKNFERQEFENLGDKAEVKAKELQNKFQNIFYRSVVDYVTDNNIHEIIGEDTVVFLSVDNHKTRKCVSSYIEKHVDDCVLISGGNDHVDGNAQIFIKKGGKKLSPSLTDFHPEIQTPDDKSPDEMSCEELHSVEPQLYFVNAAAALLMCWIFEAYLEGKLEDRNEIYFDMSQLMVTPSVRKVSTS